MTAPTRMTAAAFRARFRPLEKDVQAAIVTALRAHGYTVLETSQHRRRPPRGMSPAQLADFYRTGNSPGIADLLVRIRGALWLALEVKRDGKAARTREQKHLEATGAIVVVWSVETALEAVRQAQNGEVAA